MRELSGKTAYFATLRDFQREARTLFGGLAQEIGVVVRRYSGDDGKIPLALGRDLRVEVAGLVDDFFTGTLPGKRGRFPFDVDGVTPLAPYPRLLNRMIGQAVRGAVEPHTKYMQKAVPEDLQAQWDRVRRMGRISEQEGTGAGPALQLIKPNPIKPGQKQTYSPLRIFKANPLAQYDPPHTWVDPKGYRLSDRIWRVDEETRRKIDKLVAEMVGNGNSAKSISNAVEKYLQPGRELIRTTKPYAAFRDASGRWIQPDSLSFDGMRLGRTEIGRANAYAAKMAALANPYVEMMAWNLSLMHPKIDICDQRAKESPYPKEDAPVPIQDSHPQCICVNTSLVTKTPDEVTAQIRAELDQAEQQLRRVAPSPLQADEFINQLLGNVLAQWLSGVAA